jgi:histone H3/H4
MGKKSQSKDRSNPIRESPSMAAADPVADPPQDDESDGVKKSRGKHHRAGLSLPISKVKAIIAYTSHGSAAHAGEKVALVNAAAVESFMKDFFEECAEYASSANRKRVNAQDMLICLRKNKAFSKALGNTRFVLADRVARPNDFVRLSENAPEQPA